MEVATLMTQARLLGSETRSDGGAIRDVGATQAKHVLHASVFLRVGRQLISRTRRLEHRDAVAQ